MVFIKVSRYILQFAHKSCPSHHHHLHQWSIHIHNITPVNSQICLIFKILKLQILWFIPYISCFITVFTSAIHLSLSLYKRISPGVRPCEMFCSITSFYGVELLAAYPAPKLEDNPLSAVCNYQFSIFAATLHICWPFLCPQHEEAPCCGDRDPLIYCQD